jgi:hypothetical protein
MNGNQVWAREVKVKVQEQDNRQPEPGELCGCFSIPHTSLVNEKVLGMDGDFALVSLLICPACGQRWLRYFYEIEAITASGRWYLGAINEEQASLLKVENAKATLERLGWYYYGGSYYGGRSGKVSGRIF